jgi:hypothetical protein
MEQIKKLAIATLLLIASCEEGQKRSCAPIDGYPQAEFNKLSAEEKIEALANEHSQSMKKWFNFESWYDSLNVLNPNAPLSPEKIISKYFQNTDELKQALEAAHATGVFLAPDVSRYIHYTGAKPLVGTLRDSCDAFSGPIVKKVHAFASLAKGRMILLDEVLQLNDDGAVNADAPTLKNPYTGLWGPQPNGRHVPLIARFSIANPVVPNSDAYEKIGATVIEAANKFKDKYDAKPFEDIEGDINSLDLEFIPGLGLKFLVDSEKSLDLVAMDSLAGQFSSGKVDQNYFKYEFSPDFSKNAPMAYNTAKGDEWVRIKGRYQQNPANHLVMTLVGKRFEEAMQFAGYTVSDPHSLNSPNPFVMDIAEHAQTDVAGNQMRVENIKRPWRIVFRPALRSWDSKSSTEYTRYAGNIAPYKDQRPLSESLSQQFKKLTSSVPIEKSTRESSDFRGKLAQMPEGTIAYDVIAESRSGKRFIIGYIAIDSTPYPSEWSDKHYFVKHGIESMRYDPAFSYSVVEPAAQ